MLLSGGRILEYSWPREDDINVIVFLNKREHALVIMKWTFMFTICFIKIFFFFLNEFHAVCILILTQCQYLTFPCYVVITSM